MSKSIVVELMKKRSLLNKHKFDDIETRKNVINDVHEFIVLNLDDLEITSMSDSTAVLNLSVYVLGIFQEVNLFQRTTELILILTELINEMSLEMVRDPRKYRYLINSK